MTNKEQDIYMSVVLVSFSTAVTYLLQSRLAGSGEEMVARAGEQKGGGGYSRGSDDLLCP